MAIYKRKSANAEQQPKKETWLGKKLHALRDTVDRVARHVPGYSHLHSLGDLLYYVGFSFEYSFIKLNRSSRILKRVVTDVVSRFVRDLAGRASHAIAFSLHEIVTPFAFAHREWEITRTLVVFSFRQRGLKAAVRQLANRLGMNFQTQASHFKRSIMYLLPLASLLILVATVNTVLSYDYVLAVYVNDAPVGFIANEAVFDEACKVVNERVAIANELTDDASRKISIMPAYRMAISNNVMETDSMVDAILRVSSSKINEASALYVDDELVAITTQGDRLRADLDAILEPYRDHNDPNQRVKFGKDIEIVDGLYFSESISSYDDVFDLINGTENAEVHYYVQPGDTVWSIAYSNGLDSPDQLFELNPHMMDPGYQLLEGDRLVVAGAQKYLPVYTIRTVTYTETIPFQSLIVETDELDWGMTRVTSDGANGLKEVTADIYYLEGEEQWRNIVNEEVLAQPINEITQRGVRLKDGSVAATATGTIMWPVPNYRVVSRWMSSYHKGCDICAPKGTAILAADSGVVVAAGYNAAGRGYGESIVINHGNGMTTLYGHESELYVTEGQYVTQGQVIGAVGNTGNSSGNHCHFEIRINGSLVNARDYFPNM